MSLSEFIDTHHIRLPVYDSIGSHPPLNEFWSLWFEMIKGGLVRSTWNLRKKQWAIIKDRCTLPAISPQFLVISSKILFRAIEVSGKSAASSNFINTEILRTQLKFGSWVENALERYCLKLLKTGCAREPLFTKPDVPYTPMSPCLVAVWNVVISPVGFREGLSPSVPSAQYLLVMCFRALNILCSRGLRGVDPLLKLEKNNSRQEIQGTPWFKDLEFESEALQIVITPPNKVLMKRQHPNHSYMDLWKLLMEEEDTRLRMKLRWIKNFKEANFCAQISFSRCKFKDMCFVYQVMCIIEHRYRFYNDWNWDFLFSIPRKVQQDFTSPVGGFYRAGDLAFIPFTVNRYREMSNKWQERLFGKVIYSLHDMRRGLQMLFRRARVRGNFYLPEDVKRDYGLWKRPKHSNSESYAGLDHVLMDLIYNEVLEWDIVSLLKRLPKQIRDPLSKLLYWVC